MICGAGGIRTLVQTSSKTAFYMLSRRLIVGIALARGRPTQSVVLLFSPDIQDRCPAIPTFLMPHPEHRQEGFPGRQLSLISKIKQPVCKNNCRHL